MVVAVLVHAASPAAARRTVRFAYDRGAGAESCPAEAAVREAVTERLGYDPFSLDARDAVAVALTRTEKGFHASIEARDPAGRVTGLRSLSSGRDCAALASAMALAVAIAIDPLLVAGPAPAPICPACPACPDCPACPACPECPKCPPPPPPPPPPRVHLRATAGGHVSHGETPGSARLGVRLGTSVRWPKASLALEGRVTPQLGTPAASGDVGATLLTLAIVPCLHRNVWMACAVVAAGSLQGESVEISLPRRNSTLYAAAGGRFGVEAALWGPLFGQLGVDGLATLTRTTLLVNDEPAWTTPALSVALWAAVGATFW